MRSFHNIYKPVFILGFLLYSGLMLSQTIPKNKPFQVSEDEPVSYCNENAYLNSDDPATIEYDNMISGFHQTMIRESGGIVKTWGQSANSDGGNALWPVEVSPENGFDYEGNILKIAVGSISVGGSFILTSEGLYFWGYWVSGIFPVVYLGFLSGEEVNLSFRKILPTKTYGFEEENSKSLPTGVEPEDVKMMFVSGGGGMILTTYTGEVWVMEFILGSIRGDDTPDSFYSYWHRVHKSATDDGGMDDGLLTNVVATRGAGTAAIALTDDGEVYTWGLNTLIGEGSEPQDRVMATQMKKPTPDFMVKQIGMTTSYLGEPSYFLLSIEGDLYALGHNNQGQLGDFTQNNSTYWVRVQQDEEGNPLPPIVWISPNEHDSNYPAINALTFEGELWSWGSNDYNMIGGGVEEEFRFPFTGAVGLEGISLFGVETGGHTTLVVDKCRARYGYVGHRVSGSMGDGSEADETELNYNFQDTSVINLCGAARSPVVRNLKFCLGETANLNEALLEDIPENVQWFEDEELTQGVENPTAVNPGTYFVIDINSPIDSDCGQPVASPVYVIGLMCVVVADNDAFVMCEGGNSSPLNILDNDLLEGNPSDFEDVLLTFEEELPEWLTIDEEGIIYVESGAPAGSYDFVYRITIAENPDYFDTATLHLTISYDAFPEFDVAETYKGESVEIPVLENDEFEPEEPNIVIYLIDPDTGNYVTVVSVPSEGEYFVDSVNSTVHFIPDPDFSGLTGSVEYVIETGCGISEPADIWVLVIDLQLEMTKSVDRTIEYSEVGQIIEYQISVKNTGNLTLYNIEVTDENSEEIYIGFIEELAVGEVQNFTATHIITEEDIEAGFVENIAYAIGEDESLRETDVFSFDTDPLDLEELPDPNCPDCTFVLLTQDEEGPDNPEEPEEPTETFGPCNDNAYLNSDDPATIEYDNMISGYHHTIIREANGIVKTWGQNANLDGYSALSPIEVTPENGFDYEGEILKIASGSHGFGGASYILTSEGLYSWGSWLSPTFPSSYFANPGGGPLSFTKILPTNTYGFEEENPKSLPNGVNPEEVKMMFVTGQGGMIITTYSREVWVMEFTSESIRGQGTPESFYAYWHRVHKSSTNDGNTDDGVLSNVVASRGAGTAAIALTDDGEVYTWGWNTFLGDGGEAQDRLMATLMVKPTPDFMVKQIGMTTSFSHLPTYYLLSVEGDLYALGHNNYGQLGDFTQQDSAHWVRVQKNGEGEPLPPIAWISPNEHDFGNPAINALTFEGELWSWGSNSYSMIGGGMGVPFIFPYSGAGGTEGMSFFAVETGGHTTIVVDKCQARYGYVGHRINGSMGDGSASDEMEGSYNFEDTAIINLCGAENIPVTTDLTVCSGIMADLNAALVSEVPENVQWFQDEELTQEVENPTEVGPGTYYVVFVAGLSCDEPLAAQVQVIWEDCPIYAEDDEFILCAGQNSAPQSILDNDWLNENQADAQNVIISFEEELPDWLTVDEEGVVYVDSDAPSGLYEFVYQINAVESLNYFATATLILSIRSSGMLYADYAETYKDEAVEIAVLENDEFDQDNPPEAVYLIDPNTGNYVTSLTIPLEGTYSVDTATGSVDFTPEPGFTGLTTPIEYVVEDLCGISETADVQVFVIDLQLEMTKSVDRSIEYSGAGQIIEYQISVKNTGNYPLYNIEVTDENSEEINIGFIEELSPDEIQNFAATHIITEEDLEAGFVGNIAYALGEDEHLRETDVFSFDPNPLDLEELPDPDCPDCTFVVFEIKVEIDCYLKVFEGVSPNGDGKNDYLIIDTGECSGRIKIKIYNRWGTLVFASENYGLGKEVFDGYGDQSGVWLGSNQRLPSATYYFIAELLSDDGLRLVEKGYFYLNTK